MRVCGYESFWKTSLSCREVRKAKRVPSTFTEIAEETDRKSTNGNRFTVNSISPAVILVLFPKIFNHF